MLALLDVLGHDRVDVLGVSWGGALAQQFAWTARERCRRLVLVATGTGTLMVPGRPRVLARMATPRRYTDPDFLRRVAPDIYGGTARHDPDIPARLLHPHSPGRFAPRLRVPTAGRRRLDQHPLPAAVAAADPGPHRRRRPDHPDGQRAPARRADPAAPGCTSTAGGHLELIARPERLAPEIEEFLDASETGLHIIPTEDIR